MLMLNGRQLARSLATALGFDPDKEFIRKITLVADCGYGKPALVRVEFLVKDSEEFESVLSEYHLIPKETDACPG